MKPSYVDHKAGQGVSYRDYQATSWLPHHDRSPAKFRNRDYRSRSPPRGPRLATSLHPRDSRPEQIVQFVDSIEIRSRSTGRRDHSTVVQAISASQGGGAQKNIVSRADKIATGSMIAIAGQGNQAVDKAVDIARAHSSIGEVAIIAIPLEMPSKTMGGGMLFASDGSSVHGGGGYETPRIKYEPYGSPMRVGPVRMRAGRRGAGQQKGSARVSPRAANDLTPPVPENRNDNTSPKTSGGVLARYAMYAPAGTLSEVIEDGHEDESPPTRTTDALRPSDQAAKDASRIWEETA